MLKWLDKLKMSNNEDNLNTETRQVTFSEIIEVKEDQKPRTSFYKYDEEEDYFKQLDSGDEYDDKRPLLKKRDNIKNLNSKVISFLKVIFPMVNLLIILKL